VLNPNIKEVRRDISNPYEMHSTLKRSFTNENERFLWRLDYVEKDYPTLLVQSFGIPSWENIAISDYFISYESKEYHIAGYIKGGHVFRFRLEANPTIKRGGKRRALLTLDEQQKWFIEKAGKNGFNTLSLMIENQKLVKMEKRKTKDIIQLHSVMFEGILVVTDDKKFIENAIESGIGPAKAFGFGLLSIARSNY
jgi:CRISPR system Cascade subunit CasE